MTKHTPGPWEFELNLRGDGAPLYGFAIWAPDDDKSEDSPVADEIPNEEDARLIAAAPELLALVKESLRIAETKTPEWWDMHSFSEVDYYRNIRAAIARAEGTEL